MSIGKNIQTLRKQNNMSQDQLAQKCNVSRQTISRWECDEVLPDTNNLITISKLFNKSLDEIIFDEKIKFDEEKEEIKEKKNNWKFIGIISLIINVVSLLSILVLIPPQKEEIETIDGTYSTYVETFEEKMVLVIETDKAGNSYGRISIGKHTIMSNCLLKEMESSNSENSNIKTYKLESDLINYKIEYYPNNKIIITGISWAIPFEPFASQFELTRA